MTSYNRTQEAIETLSHASSQLASLQGDISNVGVMIDDEALQNFLVETRAFINQGQAKLSAAILCVSNLALATQDK